MKALGIGVDEMQYAFSRSAGTLKMLGLQGLQSSKDMSVLFATLIRGGMSGETAATSFNNIIQNVLDKNKWAKFRDMAKANGLSFQMFDKEGKFLGVENMVAQFDKMKDLATTKKAQLVMALTGGGGDAQALNAIITNGAEGYVRMRSEMEKKASLNDKVNAKLKTLNALWEATTGTIENMLAAIGAGLAPILKPVVDMIGKIAGTLKVWFSENPRLAQFLSMFVSLTAAAFTIAGVIKVIQGIRVAMQLLNITMKANPFILFATIAITVVSLIYTYWDKIGPFFKRLWNSIKAIFSSTWNWIKNMFLNYTPQGLVIKHWDKIKVFFQNLWQSVKTIFSIFVNWIAGLGANFWNAGKNIVFSIWNGIKAFVNKPIEAIRNMVGKIRRFLPFSPAKEGPLMDIHKIRLVETIAQSIKPNPLIDKMRHVAQLTFGVMNNGPGRSLNPVSSRGQMVISPTFNFHLSGSATKQDANMLGKEMEKQFSQLMKKYQHQQSRIAFG